MRKHRRAVRSLRRAHLVDVENLLERGQTSELQVADCARRYERLGLVGEHDHVIVASNPGNGLAVGWGWPGTRRIWRHGPSGADRALLDVLEEEQVQERFAAVVVASGDGIFTAAVRAMRERGIHVTVVSTERALSGALGSAASAVVLFPGESGGRSLRTGPRSDASS